MSLWHKLPKWCQFFLLTALCLLLLVSIWVQQDCASLTFAQAVHRLESRHLLEEGHILLRWSDTCALLRTDDQLRAVELSDIRGPLWESRGRLRTTPLEEPVTLLFLSGLRSANQIRLAGYTALPVSRMEAAITIGDRQDTAQQILLENGAFVLDFSTMEQDAYAQAFVLLEQRSYMGLPYDGELPISIDLFFYDAQDVLLTHYQQQYVGR